MSNIKFIPDEEINLNDKDLLETKRYADTLKKTILSARPKHTIGLFGHWGTGKSSIIRTVKKELENEQNEIKERIKFIIYDAWKYSGDSFRRTFILRLQKELDPNASHDNDNLYHDTIEERTYNSIKRGIVIYALIPASILAFTFFSLKILGIDLGWVTVLALTSIILVIVYKVLDYSYSGYKYVTHRNKVFAPEQFEILTQDLLEKLLKGHPLYLTKLSLLEKIAVIKELLCKLMNIILKKNPAYLSATDKLDKSAVLKKALKKLPNIFLRNEPSDLEVGEQFDKIVIVIDNIDRCDSKTSYELLTNIKSFLSNQEGVILLVPVDEEALKRHLIIENNTNEENTNSSIKEAGEFLRKFFNVVLRIKYFNNTDLFQYTDKLNKKYKLGLNEYTVNIIAREYATNPRRIIQTLNNLAAEIKFIESKVGNKFVENNQSLISILLIIREEWLDLYKKIYTQTDKIKELESYEKGEQEFFFQQVRSIIEESDILAIDKIVYNIDNDSLIPRKLIVLISNRDYLNLKVYINSKPEFFDYMIIYLIKEFNKALQRKLFKTSASKIFETILEAHKITKFNKNQLNKIRRSFDSIIDKSKELEIIDHINVDELDSFFQFVDSNYERRLNYLFNLSYDKFGKLWSVEYPLSTEFKSLIDDNSHIWIYGLESFINNLGDNNFIKNKLAPLYTTYYKIHGDNGSINYLYGKNNNKTIKKDKLEFLEIKNIVTFIIDKIGAAFILERGEIHINDYYRELNYLFDRGLVSIEALKPLFNKINLEIPNFTYFEDRDFLLYDATDELISYITKLIKKMANSEMQDGCILIQELVSFLVTSHTVYNDDGNDGIDFLYTDIGKKNEHIKDYSKTLINFFLEACRVTWNYDNISSHIVNLVNNNADIREIYHKKLLRLYRIERIKFIKIFEDDLFAETEYTDSLLKLYKILFRDKEKNVSPVSDKIKDILAYLLNNDGDIKTIDFMKENYGKKKLKEIIREQLRNFPVKDIKKILRLLR